jgi:hypothetical protein
MKIVIDTEKLDDLQITPNQYVYAALINEGNLDEFIKILQYEDEAKLNNDLYHLYQKGFLDREIETPFVIDLTNVSVKELFDSKSKKKEVSEEQFNEFFKQWFSLFPQGIRTGEVLVRGNEKECMKKMKKFIKENPYNLDIILKATSRYIERFKLKDYQFMRAAVYFINKQGYGSTLASECEEFLRTKTEKSETTYGSKRG